MSAQPTFFRQLPGLPEARLCSSPAKRHRLLERAAQVAREAMLSEGSVLSLETRELTTFPYPALFAFNGAASSPAPYVMLTNRMQVVQFEAEGERRILLFNPSDPERNQRAPFFWKARQ